MRNEHEPFTRLVALADGRLSADERADVERHLAACERCAADVAWLRRAGELIRGGTLELPPQGVRSRVRALFRAWRRPPARRSVAALRFDSASGGPPIGMRAGDASERQLIYSAEPFEIELRIAPLAERFVIVGQVLGPETAGFVEVSGHGGASRVALSEQCEFMLPPLPAGTYTLSLRLGEVEVRVADLSLTG